MGFKDAEWAYAVEGLGMREKVVLAAVCMRTLDKTHETYVGQQTIAEMISSSLDTVTRSLRDLEAKGVISRSRRNGAGGYRTSDLITVNRAYTADSQDGQEPIRPGAYKADSGDLLGSQRSPTRLTAGAEEKTQRKTQKKTQIPPISPAAIELVTIDQFDEFWAAWPKKVDKPAAKRAWDKAIKRTNPGTIVAAAIAYRNNPGIPDRQFIPHPATWLNGDRWNDELPHPAAYQSQRRPTRTEQNMSVVARFAAQEQLELKELTS